MAAGHPFIYLDGYLRLELMAVLHLATHTRTFLGPIQDSPDRTKAPLAELRMHSRRMISSSIVFTLIATSNCVI